MAMMNGNFVMVDIISFIWFVLLASIFHRSDKEHWLWSYVIKSNLEN